MSEGEAAGQGARWGLRVAGLLAIAGASSSLWGVSTPGASFLWFVAAVPLLGLAGIGWTAGIAMALVDSHRGRGVTGGRWLVAAPVVVVLASALAVGDVPFTLRWAHSRPAFEDVVEQAAPGLPPDVSRPLDAGPRLGTYPVRDVRQQGEAVIFTMTGGLFDDVGIAYLPDGPFPELEDGAFERPRFTSIGGDWYAWSASW